MHWNRSVTQRRPGVRAAAAAGVAVVLLAGCSGRAPLRQADGSLASCAEAIDCVSSQAQDPAARIEPLHYAGSREQAHRRLLSILAAMPQLRLVVNVPNYVHAEVKSRLLGPLDDIEFLFSARQPRIDMRAARRGGALASGGNRERLEAIRAAFLRGAG